MPEREGVGLAARIRQGAELSATRIILLTSGDRPGDLARFREQRVNAHLLKPVQQDDLLETIYQVMSRPTDDKVTGWQGDKVTEEPPAHPVTVSPGHLVTLSSLSILVAE